jgi:8-oxo-dGTP pyrophosphatase MutT (NUDIX family)
VSAAAREPLEEAAWRVDPTALVGVYPWKAATNGTTFVRFTFAAAAREHEPDRPLDAGIVRALWLTYEDVAARPDRHRSPLVLRSIDDYRAGKRWPLGLIANL